MPRVGFIKPERPAFLRVPNLLSMDHVQDVTSWPLGSVKTAGAAGEGWTDCIIQFVDRLRMGGTYNSRRVRYDGRLYVTHNRIPGKRIYLDGEVTAAALEYVTHVYGIDAESDKMHNATLKGY